MHENKKKNKTVHLLPYFECELQKSLCIKRKKIPNDWEKIPRLSTRNFSDEQGMEITAVITIL